MNVAVLTLDVDVDAVPSWVAPICAVVPFHSWNVHGACAALDWYSVMATVTRLMVSPDSGGLGMENP